MGETKKKEDTIIFTAAEIRKPMNDSGYNESSNEVEIYKSKSFKNVVHIIPGNHKVDNYRELVCELFQNNKVWMKHVS